MTPAAQALVGTLKTKSVTSGTQFCPSALTRTSERRRLNVAAGLPARPSSPPTLTRFTPAWTPSVCPAPVGAVWPRRRTSRPPGPMPVISPGVHGALNGVTTSGVGVNGDVPAKRPERPSAELVVDDFEG